MRRGPVYTLFPGVDLQDVDAHCGACGKRLAEVIQDVVNGWRIGGLVCVDCGQEAPQRVAKSYRAPGRRVAECRLCKWTSLPVDSAAAVRLAVQHHERAHA